MLVLTRRTGECVRIADSIVIKVVQCQGGRVRLGIEAPTQVRVMRAELAGDGKRVCGVAADKPPGCLDGVEM
jgi:carbon storage regulator